MGSCVWLGEQAVCFYQGKSLGKEKGESVHLLSANCMPGSSYTLAYWIFTITLRYG